MFLLLVTTSATLSAKDTLLNQSIWGDKAAIVADIAD